MRHFVFIESNTSGTGRLFAAAAQRLGYQPVVLAELPARYPWLAEDAVQYRQLPTNDFGALRNCLADLRATAPIAGIFSSSEYFIEAAARLAQAEGLPGADPDAIAICRDKRRQRTYLRDAGVLVPQFSPASSLDDVLTALENRSYPLVVKPAFGTGSVGVRLCANREAVLAHSAQLFERKVNERGSPIDSSILIEDYLHGPEYSVEVFGLETLGVTRKMLSPEPLFVEVGHDFPAPIPRDSAERLSSVARRALVAVGLCWGPAHIELRMTPRGPAIVEINPRLAGGFIPELVRRATGIDLIEQTLLAAARCEPVLRATCARHASIRFILPPAEGVFARAEYPEPVRASEGICDLQIYPKIGDRLRIHGDFRDRIGHVLAVAENACASAAAADATRDGLILEVSECTTPAA